MEPAWVTLWQEPTPGRNPAPKRSGLLTVADLTLHEGGGGQARADGIAEAALGVQALAGAALGQGSGAEVHVLGGWLQARGRLWKRGSLKSYQSQSRDFTVPEICRQVSGPPGQCL